MFRTPRFHCREQDLISGPAGHGNQPPYPLVHQKAKEKKKEKTHKYFLFMYFALLGTLCVLYWLVCTTVCEDDLFHLCVRVLFLL